MRDWYGIMPLQHPAGFADFAVVARPRAYCVGSACEAEQKFKGMWLGYGNLPCFVWKLSKTEIRRHLDRQPLAPPADLTGTRAGAVRDARCDALVAVD